MSSFTEQTGQHQILHLGTHAVADNLAPNNSKLIFSKTGTENNELTAYDLYDYEIITDLTVLTACETAVPTYQPGEGMVSLTHALMHAGSRSLVTSLWEIDEVASTQIIESFYQNLQDGLPRDRALQKSKLNYLQNANGRTLTPGYWGGMILLGDSGTLQLDLASSINIWIGVAVLAVLLLIGIIILAKRRATIDG